MRDHFYDGDDGQDDGEQVGAVSWARFQPSSPAAGQPWLRSGLPPWHLWGNTQPQSVSPIGGGAVPLVATNAQICRVAYGRPETWRWVFSAKLVSGPDTTAVGEIASLEVHWDLIIGIGRSAIVIPDFDSFRFDWINGAPFPFNRQIWSSSTTTPNKAFTAPGPVPVGTLIVDTFVAQDIQVNARCFSNQINIPATPVVVELSAQLSPQTHVRPDWYQQAPNELKFPGGEVPAR